MATSALQPTDSGNDREQLAAKHLSLVYHIAHPIARRIGDQVAFEDLVSAGSLGLMEALDSFDPSRGLAFSTFAVPRIRGAILDELRRQDDATRSVRRKRRTLAAAREQLGQELGRAPIAKETARFLGVDSETLYRWEADAEVGTMVELDRPAAHDSDRSHSLADILIGQDADDVEAGINREQEVAILRRAIMKLKEQERVVLSLYYYEELTLNDIAKVLGVTESRISQIRTKALLSLRKQMVAVRS
jgi:RNA polymerase sigma factor for flagellar operon FliA